jgi:hypothetical protein
MISSTSTRQSLKQEIPSITADVLVVGGGPAGVIAAISAALAGRDVILVERYGFLGGNSTQVLDTFCGFFIDGNPSRQIVGGIPDRVINALLEQNSALVRSSTYWKAGNVITYNPEILKSVWETLALQAGVRLLYHALVYDVIMFDDRVEGVVAAVKGGSIKIFAGVTIDASGDADIAAASSAPYEGPQSNSTIQSMTTTLRISSVDPEIAFQTTKEELALKMAEAAKAGDFDLSIKGGSYSITVLPGTLIANLVRISDLDPTNPFEMTQAEIEGRRQGLEILSFLKARIPGFEKAVLNNFSIQIGIRESRRIIGEYRLTHEDVLQGRRFDDEIGLGGWPIEIHGGEAGVHVEYIHSQSIYGIPYRCLLPQKVDGLLVAGRCLSADHDAHASVRVMAQCMAMGQAAGLAAHLAFQEERAPREVNVNILRSDLKMSGVVLD